MADSTAQQSNAPVRTVTKLILMSVVVAANPIAAANVDPESVFSAARYPASKLDLEMHAVERIWASEIERGSSYKFCQNYVLICKTRAWLNLEYKGDDRLSGTIWISDTDAFLKLEPTDRKEILTEALQAIEDVSWRRIKIVNKQTGFGTDPLSRQYISLTAIISAPYENLKGESIRLRLSEELGVGQAGYTNGTFVFSIPYYLDLGVKNGLAVPGDSKRFSIEQE